MLYSPAASITTTSPRLHRRRVLRCSAASSSSRLTPQSAHTRRARHLPPSASRRSRSSNLALRHTRPHGLHLRHLRGDGSIRSLLRISSISAARLHGPSAASSNLPRHPCGSMLRSTPSDAAAKSNAALRLRANPVATTHYASAPRSCDGKLASAPQASPSSAAPHRTLSPTSLPAVAASIFAPVYFSVRRFRAGRNRISPIGHARAARQVQSRSLRLSASSRNQHQSPRPAHSIPSGSRSPHPAGKA